MNLPKHVLDAIEEHAKDFIDDLSDETKSDFAKAVVDLLKDLSTRTDNRIDDYVVKLIAEALHVDLK